MNVGCAGKTVRSLENACHTWAPLRCVHDEALYRYTFTFTFTFTSATELNTERDPAACNPDMKMRQKFNDNKYDNINISALPQNKFTETWTETNRSGWSDCGTDPDSWVHPELNQASESLGWTSLLSRTDTVNSRTIHPLRKCNKTQQTNYSLILWSMLQQTEIKRADNWLINEVNHSVLTLSVWWQLLWH